MHRDSNEGKKKNMNQNFVMSKKITKAQGLREKLF